MPNTSATVRHGDFLTIDNEPVSYGRNIIGELSGQLAIQRRIFVNDPWELIAEAIARAVPRGKNRDIAQSFRRQAEDYFRVATTGRELAVRPVLLYYAFLNLSKAFGLSRGNLRFVGKMTHGVSCAPTGRQIVQTPIKFILGNNQFGVFQELESLLGSNVSSNNNTITVGQLMPQILPGHRLWCYAANKHERFFAPNETHFMHEIATNTMWIRFIFFQSNLDHPNLRPARKILIDGDLHDFELASDTLTPPYVYIQQTNPMVYTGSATETVKNIVNLVRNKLWETVRVESPYRKHYLYFSPASERLTRLPQLLSIYLMMFFLGSVTRYSPGYFDELLDSKYGPFFATFILESPMQFLYLMASEILGREISKPAIV